MNKEAYENYLKVCFLSFNLELLKLLSKPLHCRTWRCWGPDVVQDGHQNWILIQKCNFPKSGGMRLHAAEFVNLLALNLGKLTVLFSPEIIKKLTISLKNGLTTC